MDDLISVIIPVYQVERYLDRCLTSVTGQTYRNLEIILVDDGSKDQSGRMCDDWAAKDPRIRVIHKANGGLSSARNAGLDAATGNEICFVDSDDWIAPEMLQSMDELLQQYPDADMAQCDFIWSRGDAVREAEPEKEIELWGKEEMFSFFFRRKGEKSNTAVWKFLIRRKILEGFRFVVTLCEDVEASYEFYKRADQVVVTNHRYYFYFANPGGITRKYFSKRDLDYLKVWDRVLKRVKAEMPQYFSWCEFYRKRANFTMLAKMFIHGYDRKDPEMRRVHATLKAHVRKDAPVLLRGRTLPLSRKILLLILIV